MERPFQQGVKGLPTLVDNVETLAHLALIARYGARWYRELGTPDDPGTTLVTVAGKVNRPGVYEIAHGWRFEDVLAHAGIRERRAVLLGGYYGQWARAEQVRELRLDAVSLSEVGLSLGCGVIAVLDNTVCAVQELARVATWFAASSAGQCGACTWGLRDLRALGVRPKRRQARSDRSGAAIALGDHDRGTRCLPVAGRGDRLSAQRTRGVL